VREEDGLSRTALRALFYVGGTVATGAGLWTVVAGGRSLPERKLENPIVESELRFYAAFYVAYGLWVLSVAPRADRDTEAVRRAAGALFLAGTARVAAWLAVGKPHSDQRALLAIELAAPPAVIAWHARLGVSR
jgi:hypothetical protein